MSITLEELKDLRLQKCKKACTQNSLFYNQLPDSAKTTNYVNEFKPICKQFVGKRVPYDGAMTKSTL